MGFFFKSKRSSNNLKNKKPAYTDLDPEAYLSESPKATTSPLFTEPLKPSTPTTPSTGTGKSLLDDILDSFDDKKTSSYTSTYKSRGTSDYDFFKTESNDRKPYSRYSTDNYSSKYSSGSAYQSNDSSYKRVYKLGSDKSSDSDRKYDFSSKYSSQSPTTSNDRETYSIYTRYLQNEDKKDSLFSNNDNIYSNRYGSNRYGSNDNIYSSKYSSNNDNIYSSKYSSNNDNIYSSKYSSNNDNIYSSSKYTPSSTTTTYKWTNSNSNKYSTYDDDRRNRFDDDRRNRFEDIRNRFEDKYTSSSTNLFDDRPEKPSWKTSLFQERSRSETRYSENDARGKTPAQILKELRERNMETIKQKKKERGEEVSEDEEVEAKAEPKVEAKPEPKKVIVDDSDSDSSSDDLEEEEDDDDDIPLNVLEGGDNKVESWLNSQNKKKKNLKKEVVKPKIKRVGSKASINTNSKKNGESNSVSSNSTSNNSSNNSKPSKNKSDASKPEPPTKPEGIVRSNSATSLNRPNKPTKKASFSRSPSKTRVTKHASLLPTAHPSPLVNQIKPLPTAIQMPVMGQQIITASPLVQPVMVSSTPVMQPVMVPQFPQQFQPIFVNPGAKKPFVSSPKLGAKTVAPKKGSKKKKAAKRASTTPTSPTKE